MRCKEVFEILKRNGWRSLDFKNGHLIMEKDGKTTSQAVVSRRVRGLKQSLGIAVKKS